MLPDCPIPNPSYFRRGSRAGKETHSSWSLKYNVQDSYHSECSTTTRKILATTTPDNICGSYGHFDNSDLKAKRNQNMKGDEGKCDAFLAKR